MTTKSKTKFIWMNWEHALVDPLDIFSLICPLLYQNLNWEEHSVDLTEKFKAKYSTGRKFLNTAF